MTDLVTQPGLIHTLIAVRYKKSLDPGPGLINVDPTGSGSATLVVKLELKCCQLS